MSKGRGLVVFLLFVLMVSLVGCGPMLGKGFTKTGGDKQKEDFLQLMANWSVDLFREGFTEEKNYLISPFSTLLALAMTANGAANNTLAQMEQVWGIGIEELNQNLLEQTAIFENEDLYIANSLWINSGKDIEIVPRFLELNSQYYNPQIKEEEFDPETVNKINNWVEQNTEGMIKEILDEFNPGAVMYLINALAFDAQWEEPYDAKRVNPALFTNLQGEKKEIDLMWSDESYYLHDRQAIGFIKPYAEYDFSFLAILPNNLPQYIKDMNGKNYLKLLDSAKEAKVSAYLPKFSYDYEIEMRKLLARMGIQDAFDADLADFTRMAKSKTDNIAISKFLHKTFIDVDEEGTKAAAASLVEMVEIMDICKDEEEEWYEVKLDKPFIYMIIDNKTAWPIFMGTVLDIGI